jgi:superfamily II DNA or RNA helicase/HKD family nuclease
VTRDDALPDGAYERLITADLVSRLDGLTVRRQPMEEAETAGRLGQHIGALAVRRLAALPQEQRVAAVNRMLAAMNEPDIVAPGPELLTAVARQEAPGVWRLLDTRPQVPLSQPALLTNSHNDPKLGAELRAELATADRVDLLCAFVKWYGVRVLEAELAGRAARGIPLRVLTTTYMGATDRTALDRLVRDFGAEVRVNYETQSTRLHAKAWLFRRNSGYDTAYVGSSNLSRAALLDGLEWNVRLAGSHTPELLAKFEATFDSYWLDESFVPYDPETDGERLDEVLAIAGGKRTSDRATLSISGLEVQPRPHQQIILDRLSVEREVHERHRNLVVAATGTGKTVIAALDYKRLRADGRDPSLLFVAHRKEILEQSRRTYQEVLADAAFGELYVGGERPERWRHVFASVQSLSAYGVGRLPVDQFDMVVIDEFHHAEATTYRRLLDHLRPVELLGLTATPERADGVDVRSFFDGRTAAELRLWDALEEDLLSPFHYFGVADPTDLSQLQWRRGDYDTAELERVYTADDARVRVVLKQVRDKVLDVRAMRALGFCVSVGHAKFMAQRFNEAGIPALSVSGETSADDRRAALAALRAREVNVLFAVDLFNEGLDIPDVDTLLLLRPTQSATVFLQQLGRGLRRTQDKPVLTVLDLIGQQRREFRFDLKYRALTGSSRTGLERQLEQGFAYLPSGCELVLDAVAQRTVLENIRRQLKLSRRELVVEVRSHGDLDLATWLNDSGRELTDVLRGGGSWTALRRAAGLPTPEAGPDEDRLLRRVAALAHVDDAERAQAYDMLLRQPVDYRVLSGREQRYARMLFFSLWPNGGGFADYQAGFNALDGHPAVRDELRQVIALGLTGAAHIPLSLEPGMQHLTLRTHARYSREEVLAALDWASLSRKPSSFVAGVVWSEPAATDAFFVTLQKTEQSFSPTTMYRDYALSPELFHWESQNATSVDSPVGRRYLTHREGGSHVLLLARPTKVNDWGGPQSFTCLGPAQYVEHSGDRPIAITWRLRHALPADVYRQASLTA